MYGFEYMKRIYFDLIFNKKSNNLLFVPQNFLFYGGGFLLLLLLVRLNWTGMV